MTTEAKDGGRGRGRGGRGQGRGRGGQGRGRGGRGRGSSKAKPATDGTQPSELNASATEFKPSTASDTNNDNNEKQPTKQNNANAKQGNNGPANKKKNPKGGNQKKGGNNNTNDNNESRPKPDDPTSQQQKGGTTSKNKGNAKKGTKGGKNNSNSGKPSSSSQTTPQHTPSIPPNQSQQTNDVHYASGQNITVFHVGEKPSIAQAIANGLCNGEMINRKKILPVYEFSNPAFPKAPHAKKVTHKVTSVAGHVFSVDFPQSFQSWDSVDPAELFTAPIVRKPCKGSVVKHLQDEARGADFVVLWLDNDREGENINFEVLDCVLHLMKAGGGSNYDRVYRAYFSAINPSDIMKAYNNLGKPDKNQALSVDGKGHYA